jgi:hypothetical protein
MILPSKRRADELKKRCDEIRVKLDKLVGFKAIGKQSEIDQLEKEFSETWDEFMAQIRVL